jgi:hypothetical protein
VHTAIKPGPELDIRSRLESAPGAARGGEPAVGRAINHGAEIGLKALLSESADLVLIVPPRKYK